MDIDKLCLSKFVGQIVTVYVTAGGLAGSGFTGILASYNDVSIRLITRIGTAPACPIGSACFMPTEQYGNSYQSSCSNFQLGSVCEIPLCRIVAFTHNSI